MIIYEVKPHDNLYSISKRYNISPGKVISDNRLSNPEDLVAGQTLVLLPENMMHTVRRGESLYSIAKNYGITLRELQDANPALRPPYRLTPGMHLNIPAGGQKYGEIYVNGYTFPGINRNLLQSVLPNLTYLSIFSYHARPDGTLIALNDASLIQMARQAEVAPMMVVTNMEEEGGFSSDLAHTLLSDKEVQKRYIQNILDKLKEKDYYGLDIDFEYVFPEDRKNYNEFISEMAARLSPEKITLTTALAPKHSEEQHGLLYSAHDYPHHGKFADHVILMTYEWGYTKGPAMAVAPIKQVKKVLDYATSVIPSEKILLGIPNYGYDWTLPFVKGSSARSLSNIEAVDLARDIGAGIQYDEISQAPYFYYYDEDKNRHEVWFQDARSVQAALRLVDQYNLGGVSYWTINRPFPQNWLVLSSMYDIKKLL